MEISYNVVRNVLINKMYPVRRSLFRFVWAVALELYRHLSTEHFSLHNQTWTLIPSVLLLENGDQLQLEFILEFYKKSTNRLSSSKSTTRLFFTLIDFSNSTR